MSNPNFLLEAQHGYFPVAGIDEAGRGPWAGPVVAATVVLTPDFLQHPLCREIQDSKKLASVKRIKLKEDLASLASLTPPLLYWSVGQASVEEIDVHNILQATFLAMKRALDGLSLTPSYVLIDGPYTFMTTHKTKTVVKGDQKSLSIATASIFAKVTRDQHMKNLAREYPLFGWEQNMGYGTAKHREALLKYGPTQHHRRSYKPVMDAKQLWEKH